jgi:hypothetical protein
MFLTDEGRALNFNASHLTLVAAENGVDETHILDCTLRETRSMSGNTSYAVESVDLPLESDCRDSEGNPTPEVAHLLEVYKRNDAERELVRERKRKLEVHNSR